jgi:hypothetical protein
MTKATKGTALLPENAPVSKACKTTAIKDCDYKKLKNPPFSPDLASSDYSLF